MDIKSKVLRLEREIFGRGGLPSWAIEVAVEHFRWKRLYKYNEAYLSALKKIIPEYQQESEPQTHHPISMAETVEEFAADLLTKFRTKQAYEEWQRRRYVEGCAKMMETIKRLKGVQGDAA